MCITVCYSVVFGGMGWYKVVWGMERLIGMAVAKAELNSSVYNYPNFVLS
jgi:hypothetical protein